MRRFTYLSRVAVAVLGLVLLTGCESQLNMPWTPDPDAAVPEGADFVETEPLAASSFDAIWERARLRLNHAGYRIDSSRTSRAERELISAWKTQLAPTRYKGRRTRAWLRFLAAEDGTYSAQIAIQLQVNADIRDPTNPAGAMWRVEPSERRRAAVLAYQLEQDFVE